MRACVVWGQGEQRICSSHCTAYGEGGGGLPHGALEVAEAYNCNRATIPAAEASHSGMQEKYSRRHEFARTHFVSQLGDSMLNMVSFSQQSHTLDVTSAAVALQPERPEYIHWEFMHVTSVFWNKME